MRRLLLPSILLLLAACARENPSAPQPTLIVLEAASPATRAYDPDENKITDCNLLIFNRQGFLEERVYVPARALKLSGGKVIYRTELLQGAPYIILAAANLGYELPCHSLEEALQYRYYMAYPDEYTQGMPMAAYLDAAGANEEGVISVKLQRLMARIDLNIDRTALSKDVNFKVREVLVGGCPSSAFLFQNNKVAHNGQLFINGFQRNGNQVNPLNQDVSLGISGSIRLYLLENCQGDLLENVETDSGKVFTEGLYNQVCSYLELRAEYSSGSYHTRPGSRLVYRFYLGEDRNNFDVERNCIYTITVKPEGSGLSEDSWRVDKSQVVAGSGY